jgi:hypothetical protein
MFYEKIAGSSNDCMIKDDQHGPSHFPSPDMESVSYVSDGKTLNATLWLSSPVVENSLSKPLNYSQGNLSMLKKNYGMAIDVESDNEGQGGDYLLLIQWDNNTKTWIKELFELGSEGSADYRSLDRTYNHTDFFDKGKNYIVFSLDLDSINSPDRYSILFAPFDEFLINDLYCNIGDFTAWYHIPPPSYNVTVSPSTLNLRPGEQKDIQVNLKLISGISPEVILSTNQINGIETELNPDRTTIPPYGLSTSFLHVKALENATAKSYSLNLYTQLNDSEAVTFLPTDSTIEGTYKPQSKNKTIGITIEVLPPLRFDEHINNFYNSWLVPINGIWTFVAGIAAVLAPLIIKKFTKRKKHTRIKTK